MKNLYYLILAIFIFFSSCNSVLPPEPVGALPSESQLKWHETNYYAFVHFNMNTFNGDEWGFGDSDPSTFNPTELDCRQWARVCKDAGMKGIIITAKHHDGFCLWPSAYTDYSVKNSKWKDGKGDVIKELSEACKEYGLKFGVYLSPWDRHQASYGTPEYITYYRNQLRELLTNYGDIFEVWLDGANGGTGYYGGANERRTVDQRTYYDWPNTFKLVYDLQPNAIIFSDGGPGCRWVGNEWGLAYRTNWCTLNGNDFSPGVYDAEILHVGQEDGTDWLPAECDVSTRPSWYYHPYEDHKVRKLPNLLDIYYNTIGRSANLIMNFPVDKRGLIPEPDAEQVLKLANQLKLDFANDLAKNKKITASSVRGRAYKTKNLNDGNPETYWATPDNITTASIEVNLGEETEINRLLLQEYIALGQRVRKFSVEAFSNNKWQKIAEETTIGYKRILRFPDIKASKVRINIEDSKACPTLSNIEIYRAPKVLTEPKINRDKEGLVTISAAEENAEIYFTTDGAEPNPDSDLYKENFNFSKKGTIKAIVVDPVSGETSPVATVDFDIPATKWEVISPTPTKFTNLIFNGKEDDGGVWFIHYKELPLDVVVDLGEIVSMDGFFYTPTQETEQKGIIVDYEFFVSNDGKRWGEPVAEGEFSNIKNNPIKQDISFEPQSARFVKLRAKSVINNGYKESVGIAEFGIKTR